MVAESVLSDIETLIAEFKRELPWHMTCSPKVAQDSAYLVRHFLNNQKEPFPACLTYPVVVRWLDHLANTPPHHRPKQKRAASTVNQHLKSLKRFSKWAVARNFIDKDPIAHLKGLKEQDRMILSPEREQVVKLLRTAVTHGQTPEIIARNYALLCLMIDVGPRASEVLKMDYDDVVDEDGKVRDAVVLHGKGARDRIVAFNPPVIFAIDKYLPLRRPKQEEMAFWLTDDGDRMTYHGLRSLLQRMTKKAGIRASSHDFRRYALTQMWMSEMDQVSAMAISGHKTTSAFLRYIRSGIMQRAVIEHRLRSPLGALEKDTTNG